MGGLGAAAAGFSACNCLFDSRNCLLTSLKLGSYYKLNWPKRVPAVYWLLGTLLYPWPLAQAFRKRNGLYECLRCNHTSDQLTNIRNHVDARHRDSDKSYVCEECNSEYKTLNSMRAHRSRVHGRKRKLEEERRNQEGVIKGEAWHHHQSLKGAEDT